jgi:acetolactate synthase-1/2/3 large subunit
MVLVEGDGSLQLNIQEMATLSAFNLPICLIIMNNQGYASIRTTQGNYFKGRYVGTGPEAGLKLPDLKKVALTYQIPYIQILDACELKQKLSEAMNLTWPIIIDVSLAPNEVLTPKVAAIPQPDGSMLSMPLEDMSPLLSIETMQKEMIVGLSEASLQAREQK